jgi:hypothetical protein
LRRPLEQILASPGCEAAGQLVDEEQFAWARAGDLVVGLVHVAPGEEPSVPIRRAYEALDALPPRLAIAYDETWSVVLFVQPVGEDWSEQESRQIEGDMGGSRKVVVRRDDTRLSVFPSLDAGSATGDASEAESPVEAALDAAAAGKPELRQALNVLLEQQRSSAKVQALIRALEADDDATH